MIHKVTQGGIKGPRCEKEGQFKENTKMPMKCSCCDTKYVTTEKNVIIRTGHIVNRFSYQDLQRSFLLGVTKREMTVHLDDIIEYSGICPNCSVEQKLFYERTGNKSKKTSYSNPSLSAAF